jgi:hypothetical protein
MPWELGYFDGFKPGYVWILPLVMDYDSEFKGQEYLGLYPTVEDVGLVAGRVDLGFRAVRVEERAINIPLAKAVTGAYGGGIVKG